MPVEGGAATAAIQLADETIAREGGGSILWITDSIAPEQGDSLEQWRQNSDTQVRLFSPLLEGAELNAVVGMARSVDAEVVRLSADDSDVKKISSAATFAATNISGSAGRWEDGGYWLMPFLACLILPFFRRGWMVSTAAKA